MLRNLFIVAVGGGIGSISRYIVSHIAGRENFPLHTLMINVVGSFIIGIVLGFSLRDATFPDSWKLFLATGFCGGFTTFSAFSLENFQLLHNGKLFLAFLYILLSITFGIAATWMGVKLVIK